MDRQALLVSSTSTRSRELCASCCWPFCLYIEIPDQAANCRKKKKPKYFVRSQEGRPVYFHIQQALPLHTLLLLHQFDCRAIVAPASASSHSFILLLLLRLLRINSTTKAAICFHLSEKEDAVDAARASSQELNQASFVCVCVCCQRSRNHSGHATYPIDIATSFPALRCLCCY